MSVKKQVERNQYVFRMFLLQGMNFKMLSLRNWMLSKFGTLDGKKWVSQLSLGDDCNNESQLGCLRVLESSCLIRKVVSGFALPLWISRQECRLRFHTWATPKVEP
jgi:hypothetical protein